MHIFIYTLFCVLVCDVYACCISFIFIHFTCRAYFIFSVIHVVFILFLVYYYARLVDTFISFRWIASIFISRYYPCQNTFGKVLICDDVNYLFKWVVSKHLGHYLSCLFRTLFVLFVQNIICPICQAMGHLYRQSIKVSIN